MEDGGERWSKPYVATLSLHSLFELRSCILNGTVLLDMRASSIEEIAGEGRVCVCLCLCVCVCVFVCVREGTHLWDCFCEVATCMVVVYVSIYNVLAI